MIIKNYPRLINVAANPIISQEYKTSWNASTGHQKFIVEKEQENIFTIPLGTCNNYNPIPNKLNRNPGGFIGQWTQFRQQKIENIISSFDQGQCPYTWAFYNGFGPFVQKGPDETHNQNTSLDSEKYSSFMSGCEISFIPGGQSAETYRLFEAALAGCIAVHDILPDIWYYDDLPYIPLPVEDESFLNIKEYIDDNKENIKALTSKWWQTTVSPVSVGKKIAEKAKELGL